MNIKSMLFITFPGKSTNYDIIISIVLVCISHLIWGCLGNKMAKFTATKSGLVCYQLVK